MILKKLVGFFIVSIDNNREERKNCHSGGIKESYHIVSELALFMTTDLLTVRHAGLGKDLICACTVANIGRTEGRHSSLYF
jgi:hypothetical protein